MSIPKNVLAPVPKLAATYCALFPPFADVNLARVANSINAIVARNGGALPINRALTIESVPGVLCNCAASAMSTHLSSPSL